MKQIRVAKEEANHFTIDNRTCRHPSRLRSNYRNVLPSPTLAVSFYLFHGTTLRLASCTCLALVSHSQTCTFPMQAKTHSMASAFRIKSVILVLCGRCVVCFCVVAAFFYCSALAQDIRQTLANADKRRPYKTAGFRMDLLRHSSQYFFLPYGKIRYTSRNTRIKGRKNPLIICSSFFLGGNNARFLRCRISAVVT